MGPSREHKKSLVLEMCRAQGGFCTISDIRRAAGVQYGDPVAKELAKEGRLLHVAHDHYKLVATSEEAEMAKRDRGLVRKPRRGKGSY
jgi:hypothetical protein